MMMDAGQSPCTRRQGTVWSLKRWEHLAAQGLLRRVWSEMTRNEQGLCQNPLLKGGQSRIRCQVWKFERVLQLLGQILLC